MLRAASGCGGLLHCSARAAGAAAGGAVAMAAPGSKDSSGRRLGMLETAPYRPPSWAEGLHPMPSHWTGLGHLPTPVHRWDLPSLPEGTQVWIKRDDLTGLQLSGNKVRKLEFLLADAKLQGADCVITIGGIQSNHCRATAVAARYLGLDSFLILRTSQALLEQDPGLQGNLLVERLVGANLELVSKEEYQAHGSVALGERLAARLRAEGRKPYLVPVGGSNSLGSWGYLEAVRELELQLEHGDVPGASSFHDVVMACGSGGTTAGAAVGCRLGSLQAKVHAYAVCDSPDYFYDYVQGLISGLGSELKARDVVRVVDAKGLGYAVSTREELEAVKAVAEATGVILDPVYSGKALIALLRDMEREPEAWKGRNVLFWHTGGLLGLYDKVAQLQPLVGRCQRFLEKVEEKETSQV